MPFTKLLAVFLCLLTFSGAKPLEGSFAPRQDPTPTASSQADSTACGDIIIAVNNSTYSLL
jgi:hypothetical protein